MSESDLAARMKTDALEAQKFSRKHLVLELDFSEASIDQMEAHADSVEYALKGGKSEANVEMLCRTWGAYIGEAIRKQCGGEWVEEDGLPTLRAPAGSAQPQQQVRRRLLEGAAHHLGDYFRQIRTKLSG